MNSNAGRLVTMGAQLIKPAHARTTISFPGGAVTSKLSP